jgi:hypothetical protein
MIGHILLMKYPTLLVADEDPVDGCCCDGSIFLLNKFLNAPKSERPWHYVALMAEYLLQ